MWCVKCLTGCAHAENHTGDAKKTYSDTMHGSKDNQFRFVSPQRLISRDYLNFVASAILKTVLLWHTILSLYSPC